MRKRENIRNDVVRWAGGFPLPPFVDTDEVDRSIQDALEQSGAHGLRRCSISQAQEDESRATPEQEWLRLIGGPKRGDRVLARIQMEDEVKRIAEERTRTEERLRRLGRAYVDGLYSDDDYKRQKRELEDRVAGLVVPEADAAKAAGEMLQDLPKLWSAATPSERRRLLLTMLDAVYVDTKEEHRVVAIRAKPSFRPLLEIATARPDSDVTLYVLEKETPAAWGEQQALSGPCFWWRRGRVELPVQRIPRQNMLQV